MIDTMVFRYLCCIIILLIHSVALATPKQHAAANFVLGQYAEKEPVQAGINFQIDPDWHIYWRTAGDSGFPVTISTEGSDNVKQATFLWPVPTRHIDYFDDIQLESYIYKNQVIFPLIIERTDPSKSTQLKLQIDYAICHDICVAESATINATLPSENTAAPPAPLIEAWKHIPQKVSLGETVVKNIAYQNNLLDLTLQGLFNENRVFLESEPDTRFYFKEVIQDPATNTTHYRFKITAPEEIEAITTPLALTYALDSTYYETTIPVDFISDTLPDIEGNTPITISEFLWIILIAWLGGLILNIMPCVLPVLSIKLMGIVKYSHYSPGKIRLSFLVSAAGIVTSFGLLALIVLALKQAGHSIGWGFHFQQPYFIIFLILVLSLFAANMWGLLTISLPISTSTTSSKSFWVEHFLTGMMATLLATPCTAPFLGTAVSFALSHGTLEITLIFIAMGVGLATPYILVGIRPALASHLPKPGTWMHYVKHILGTFLAMTALWLLWILSNQLGILASGLLAAIIIVKWLKLWYFRHHHRMFKIVVILIATILAFLIPRNLPQNMPHPEKTAWIPFDQQTLERYVTSGHIVFVDITADWCLTCKANKFFVLNTEETSALFSQYGVVLMQGDWTNKNAKIYDYLQSRGVYGIPFNAVYGPQAPDGINLPVLLSYDDIKEAITSQQGSSKN